MLDDDEGSGRGRPSAAQLRAEAAAERIEARRQRERAEAAEARASEADARVEAVRTEERSRTDAITQRYRARIVDSELRAAALAEGLVDPDLVPLIPRTGIAIDDADAVTGITEAITAYKQAKPMFFRTSEPLVTPPPAPAPGAPPVRPATGSSRPAPSPAPATPSADNVRNLSRDDYRSRMRNELGKLRGMR